MEKLIEDQIGNDGKLVVWTEPAKVSPGQLDWVRRELAAVDGVEVTAEEKTIREWLSSLGALTAGSMALTDARIRISAYVSMLLGRPSNQFTKASLEYVASQCTFFPAYGEIEKHLDAWKARRSFRRERLRKIVEANSQEAKAEAEHKRTPDEQATGELFFAWFRSEVFMRDRPELSGLSPQALITRTKEWALQTGYRQGAVK